MNIEEQCLDLCNVKMKNNVDDDHNTTNNTEGVIPRISELMTDSNTEKQSIVPTEASETYLMPQLTDNLQTAEENNQQAQNTVEIDEVNGNGKNSAQDPPAVVNPTDFIFSTSEQHEEKMKEDKDNNPAKLVLEEGDYGGDMDIGVDLSLDESGVLEAESVNVRSLSDSNLDSVSTPQDVPAGSTTESQADASQTCSIEASATDPAGLYPSVQEGDTKHKSGKRVTFPSDEDIISGAVEPKDPWRHGNFCLFFFYMFECVIELVLRVCCACMNMSAYCGLLEFILRRLFNRICPSAPYGAVDSVHMSCHASKFPTYSSTLSSRC